MEENLTPSTIGEPTLKSYRSAAKSALSGHWVNAVLCTLVFLLISGVAAAIAGDGQAAGRSLIGTAVTLLIVLPLGFGYSVSMLQHMQGMADDDLVTRPFQAFKQYGRYLGTSILMTVFIFLWSLLLIIPGIVKGYAYTMTPYIMHEHPELSANECIDASKKMMKGHKWRLFLLDLSFIGWLLLCVLTLGILTLWVQPWMECSRISFYEQLKSRQA